MEAERKRFNASERDALLNLEVAITAANAVEALDRRIGRIKRGRFWHKSGVKSLSQLVELLLDTMPTEQLISVKRNLPHIRWEKKIVAANGKTYKDDGVWVSFDALDALCDGVRDRCMTCNKDNAEQRKCPLAKALDELPVEHADENAPGCRYFCGF